MILLRIFFILLTIGSCTTKEDAQAPADTAVPNLETVDFFSGKNGSIEGIKCPAVIVPGLSIGPIELGMPRQNIFTAGLVVKQLKASPNDFVVGPFLVTLSGDKVAQVEVEPRYLKECLVYKDNKISHEATMEELVKLFPDCQPMESRRGGHLSQCKDVIVKQGSMQEAAPTISISTLPPPS